MSFRALSVFFIFSLLLVGCIQAPRMRTGSSDDDITSAYEGEVPGDADSATDDDDATATPTNCDSEPNQIGCPDYNRGMAELTHLVDPFDGSYQTKVTVPRNFTGIMYLAGLNIYSLKNRLVHVRFSFGRGLEPVTIQAQVGKGSGITPETDSELLILNIQDQPFYNMSLQYSLYDYNDYDSDSGVKDGIEQGTPVTDPLDGNLFCRGLKIEYDPTFEATAGNPLCNQSGNICKYAYASLMDQGLYYDHDSNVATSDIAYIPTEAQIDLVGTGYATISSSTAVKKCLPDSANLSTLNAVLGLSLAAFPSLGTDIGIGTFQGPFYSVNEDNWEISGAALFSEVTAANSGTGLFQQSYSASTTDPSTGYKSFLFPRGGTMSLASGIEYIGTADSGLPHDSKSIQSLSSNGDTNYMDGCNFRVNGLNPHTGEGISSCNVTAKIEIIEIDQITQVEEVITSSTTIKLQLIAPSNDLADATGLEEVLYSPIKSCGENSRNCGGDECCFNGRCWSKDLVSQCREDAVNAGLLSIGEYCVSDFQCASLCCDASSSVCNVHKNSDDEQVLCQKAPGQACVSKEYCAQENIAHCNIYKTDIDTQGKQLCDIRCFTVKTHGSCVNGTCVVPQTPTVPTFDPSTYDCSQALDYPTTGFEDD